MTWGIKWRSENCLEGKAEHLLGRYRRGLPPVPAHMGGHTTMVFETRAEARAHIQKHFAYIRRRLDLCGEPHGWKMPQAVRVSVEVREIL